MAVELGYHLPLTLNDVKEGESRHRPQQHDRKYERAHHLYPMFTSIAVAVAFVVSFVA